MTTNYYETLLQEDLNVGVGTAQKRNPGGGVLVGTQVGLHSLAVGQLKVTDTWALGNLPALGNDVTDVTVTGAALGDFVMVSLNIDTTRLMLHGAVTAANNVRVVVFNPSSSSIDLTNVAITLSILVFKSR